MAKQTSKTVRFSIADVDYYFKEILIKNLLTNPFYTLVHNCNNGYELINKIFRKQETLFLIDLYMPILSGLETIKFIRSSDKVTPIIAYSATYQEDVFSMLNAYPNVFYCQKKSVIILNTLHNYVMTPSNNYADYLEEWAQQPLAVNEYMERQKKGWYDPTLIEIQIMKLCYEGLSNKEIGQYLNLSTRTIDTYIKRLTEKLGIRNKIDLIRFCVEQGYYNSCS